MKMPAPLLTPSPCIPADLASDCKGCTRLATEFERTNHLPVIDATKAAWPAGVCPMRNEAA